MKALVKTLILLMILSLAPKTYAQNTLKVKVLDSLSKAPVEMATFSVKYIGEAQAKRYALTDSLGEAILKATPVGRATVTVEFVGYKQHKQVFDVHKGANDMGVIYLQGENELKTIFVTAAGNQMTVKKDTIEYNANSFKTNETDMLEELLKKLPGVEIDSDGKITANGKEITKIMIDGKTFFMDDPQLASKNLPAKIVDKVKVVEKKSDEAKFTGIDDGDEETVLDLSIKKGMANGWLGNMGGGYGSLDRYEGSLMVGRFSKNLQLSIIGNANNTNNRGFNDMAGSMMRSMMGSGMQMGGGGMRGGGGFSFTGSGITASKMIGTNINYQTDDKKWQINTSYLYSGTNKDVEETRDKVTMFKENDNLYNKEKGAQNTVSYGHRFDSEIEYTPSDATSFIFRPYFRIGNGSFDGDNLFRTLRNSDTTNVGSSRSFGDNTSASAGGSLVFRQRLWKPGRTLTARINYSFSNNSIDGNNFSETDYYENNLVNRFDKIDQNYHNNQRSNGFGANMTYTEPLGKNYFVQASYRYNYSHSNSSKATLDYNPVTDRYDIVNDEYSNNYKGDFTNQRIEIALRKQEEKYNFMFGVSAQPSKTKSVGTNRDTSYSVTNFAPTARLDYRFSDSKFLRVYYRGRTSQPSLSQLLPIPDNSNPLFVQEGNDKLNPSFTHSFGGEYRTNNKQTFSWFGMSLDASYTSDNIINQKTYTDDGVQHSKYINSDKGIYSIDLRSMYNAKIGKSDFNYFVMAYLRYNNGVSYVSSKGDFVENVTKNFNANVNLRLTYRTDNLEIGVGGGTNYRNAWYSVKSLDKVSTWQSRLSGNLNWTFLNTFNVSSDINYRFYNGYSGGYGDAQTIWNGEISKTFLKNAFTFKVRVYDILNKTKNVYRTTTENYVQDVANNSLGRYVMFTLTFRFGSFGSKGNKGGMMGGPMRGPMGGHGRR